MGKDGGITKLGQQYIGDNSITLSSSGPGPTVSAAASSHVPGLLVLALCVALFSALA